MQLFSTPWNSPWSSPSQNTGVGSRSLLQGIFPTQGSNPGLEPRSPALQAVSLPDEPPGKPKRKSIIPFTVKTRSAEMPVILVSMTRQSSVPLFLLDTVCLCVNKNYLHYSQFSTSYFFSYKVKVDFSKINKSMALLQE